MLRLRATTRVYLEERLSPSRTARRLGIHQNTVLYRVKQVGDILGARSGTAGSSWRSRCACSRASTASASCGPSPDQRDD